MSQVSLQAPKTLPGAELIMENAANKGKQLLHELFLNTQGKADAPSGSSTDERWLLIDYKAPVRGLSAQ